MTKKNYHFCQIFFLSFLFISLSFSSLAQYTEDDIYAYIDQYNTIAVNKMKEYKIPASITLAQGIFESACGTSKLACEGNNHFGIKCHNNWTGETILIDDDQLQECFRKYNAVEDSYNDHSLFLTTRERYKPLFSLDIMDYNAWANGLKAAGYATNPEYANRLISLIERFNLHKWDSLYNEEKPSDNANIVPTTLTIFTAIPSDFPISQCPWTEIEVYENNKTQFVIAKKGDTYRTIASSVQRSEKELRKYNDAPPASELIENQVVYIESKGKKSSQTHVVAKGETLIYIAQKYAIQLHYVLSYNNITKESIIHPGDTIKLTY